MAVIGDVQSKCNTGINGLDKVRSALGVVIYPLGCIVHSASLLASRASPHQDLVIGAAAWDGSEQEADVAAAEARV